MLSVTHVFFLVGILLLLACAGYVVLRLLRALEALAGRAVAPGVNPPGGGPDRPSSP
ncbi:MAG: hypothetical protein ACRENY_08715 [Candidatus Dormibacteria bacterium]